MSTEPSSPHIYQIGAVYEAILTVTDAEGASGADSVVIDVVDGAISVMATNDLETLLGTVTAGSYLDTGLADGIHEELTEQETKGEPSLRQTLLPPHTWTFDVVPGVTQIFYVSIHHTPSSEGNHFVFEYSRDGVASAPVLVVSATAPDSGRQSFALLGDFSGTLYVRVTDTDRSAGNRVLDTLFVDEMVIVTSWQIGSLIDARRRCDHHAHRLHKR